MAVYVNVQIPNGKSGVAGPFDGRGQVQLMAVGIHVYASQNAASAATPQTLNSSQIKVFEQVILEGPGIGSGFFGLGKDAKAAISAPLTGINAIGDFFSRLTEASTWVRVGEFVAGGLLLYISGNALLRDTAAGNAVQSAKRTATKAIGATPPAQVARVRRATKQSIRAKRTAAKVRAKAKAKRS